MASSRTTTSRGGWWCAELCGPVGQVARFHKRRAHDVVHKAANTGINLTGPHRSRADAALLLASETEWQRAGITGDIVTTMVVKGLDRARSERALALTAGAGKTAPLQLLRPTWFERATRGE